MKRNCVNMTEFCVMGPTYPLISFFFNSHKLCLCVTYNFNFSKISIAFLAKRNRKSSYPELIIWNERIKQVLVLIQTIVTKYLELRQS